MGVKHEPRIFSAQQKPHEQRFSPLASSLEVSLSSGAFQLWDLPGRSIEESEAKRKVAFSRASDMRSCRFVAGLQAEKK